MEKEHLIEKYDRAELRFYDKKTFEKRQAVAEVQDINLIFLQELKYGYVLKGSAEVYNYSYNSPHMLDSICFHVNGDSSNTILADKVGAQLWEVHEQYKRRIV